METYETSLTVRFADIDHAGIVYYPRFLHYCHVAYEDFFAERVGIPLRELLDGRRVGFPSVRADIRFAKPLRLGERARIEVVVTRLGRSSVDMRYRIRRDGEDEVAAEAVVTTVCVDMDSFRTIPTPNDIRRILEAHAVPGAPAAEST